jgi:glycosyltransferase involved in cell wall biosynthesis
MRQDMPPSQYEVIIVNDGSTDSTSSILRRLALQYSNIRIIEQENQGRDRARNIGASCATGRYMWFIDNDDEISKNCLASVVSIAEGKSLDVLVVAPPAPFMNDYVEGRVSCVISGKEFLRKGASFWAPWMFLIRRDFYMANGFEFKLRYFLEDIELMYRVFYRVERLAALEGRSCYNYLKHPESETCKPWNRNKLLDFTRYLNLTEEFVKTEVKELDIKNIFERLRTCFYLELLNHWKTIKSEVTLDELLSNVHSRPQLYYGSPIGRLYQRVAVYFPYFFVRLK